MEQNFAKALAISVAFMSMASIFVLRGPIGKALAERLAGRAGRASSEDEERLRAEVDELRHRLGEMEERLDFAERMVAKSRGADRIGAAGT
jgi:hypothetical protein